ncbi:MAG: T9SS type A sorting domain-containing protein [bacterium]
MKKFLFLYLAGMVFLLVQFSIPVFSQDTCWWQNWEKSEANPLFPQDGEDYWFSSAYSKAILYQNGIYRMWFSAWEASTDQYAKVSYAESENGTDWIIDDQPLFSGGSEGAWNHVIFVSSVLLVNDTLRMWYTGSPTSNPSVPSIGYAWSLDGETWTLYPEAVFTPPVSSGSFNSICEILYADETYHMYFGNASGISYAWSTDGITWTLYDDNPVIEKLPGTFYDYGILPSGMILENDTIHMWFSGATGIVSWRIGYAWSTDWVNWTVHEEIAMLQGLLNEWDGTCVFDAHVILDDGIYKMWFTGFKQGSIFRIGYAEGPSASTLCLANGYMFTSQEKIENFKFDYPYCKKIVGNVEITGNEIKMLNDLEQLEAFGGMLKIDADSLEDLTGLQNVSIIEGDLILSGNKMLQSLDSLKRLQSIGGTFDVKHNDMLENFMGLEQLSEIGNDLWIGHTPFGTGGNPVLMSLEGLETLDTVGGDIKIVNNAELTVCNITSICSFVKDTAYIERITIENNAAGCESVEEVQMECAGVGLMELPLLPQLSVYPNPIRKQAVIRFVTTHDETVEVSIYNLPGEKVLSINQDVTLGTKEYTWDASAFPPGIYFVRASSSAGTRTVKVIKVE